MTKHTVVEYTFDEEHSQIYAELLRALYKNYRHSTDFIHTKTKIKKADNPFFRKGDITNFIAYDGFRPVGHISAVVDPRLKGPDNEQIGLVAFYECSQNISLSKLTFQLPKTCAT